MKVVIEIEEDTASNLWWALGIAEGCLTQQGRPEAAEAVMRTFMACREGSKEKEAG